VYKTGKLSCSYKDGQGKTQTFTGWSNLAYEYADTWPTWVSFNDASGNRAAVKFRNSIREAQVRVSGPTFLGEMRETLRMLRKPAAGLQNLLEHYLNDVTRAQKKHRGRPKPSAPRPKNADGTAKGSKNPYRGNDPVDPKTGKPYWYGDLSALWLEYSFGWVPFLKDIDDALQAYWDKLEEERVVRISEGGKDFYSYNDAQWLYTWPGISSAARVRVHGLHRQTSIVRYKGAVKAQAVTTYKDRAARWGFTPSEFVPTAWELLPWSFLVDYFVNIGEVLEAAVTDTSNVMFVNRSIVHKNEHVYTQIGDPAFIKSLYPTSATYQLDPGEVVKWDKTVTRDSDVGVPMPTLITKLPTSPSKLANMLALFAQTNSNVHPQRFSGRNYRL
jgi:hypothetical protein